MVAEPVVDWIMPEWMEPYRSLIGNTGGDSVEGLMNDHSNHLGNNAIRAALCIAVDSQVTLLYRLRKEGHLAADTVENPHD